MRTLLCASLLVAAAARAQAPAKEALSTSPAALAAMNGYLGVAADGSGLLWASGADYKVAFPAVGPEFHPFLGADATCSTPVALRLRSATVAGTSLEVRSAAPRSSERRVNYDRGGLHEIYDLRDDGIEQTFRFDRLPSRGAVQVTLDVASELAAVQTADGIEFRNERGGVRYGRAVAIDAAGNRCEVREELCPGGITLSVPEQFVAHAVLPLVIDPLIATATLHSNSRQVTATDICWLKNQDEYWVCFERAFSATDTDVYVVRCDSSLAVLGTPIVIDASTTSWSHARMAGLNQYNRCLVVAEQSTGNVAPFAIVGRIVVGGNTPAALSGFDIQRVGVAGHNGLQGIHPDVGGDPGDGATAIWTVAWEAVFSPADHDIKYRTVLQDGTLGASVVTVDAATTFEHDPVCSKSNGAGWMSSKFTAIAYRRDTTPGSGAGQTQVGFANDAGVFQGSFAIGQPNTVTSNGWAISSPLYPNQSSPTPGAPYLLAESVMIPQLQVSQIQVTACSPQGVVLAGPLGISGQTESASRPRVCSDTMRFCVAWQSTFSVSPADEDVLVATLAYQNGQLFVHDADGMGYSYDVESWPCVTTRMEGGDAVATPIAAVAWAHNLPGGTFAIEAGTYATFAAAGGVTMRPTGCGSLQIQPGGFGAIGTPFSVQLINPSNVAGFVFGTPTTLAIPICPSCTQGVVGSSILTNGYGFHLPNWPILVGVTISFQGFDFGSGPCLGLVRLTDTVDVQIR
jgi:hypothetical protein